MSDLLPLLGAVVTLAGSFFLLLAAIGLIRMPDVYNRMQAGTKATTLGSLFVLLGLGLAQPSWTVRLLILALFIVFTNPISSHVMIRSAHHAGVPLAKQSVTDALREEETV
jgi:multicomponent Na+:H+ antiporter subunit G